MYYLLFILLSLAFQSPPDGHTQLTAERSPSLTQSPGSATRKPRTKSVGASGKLAFISEVGAVRSLYLVDPNHLDVSPLGKLHVNEGEIDQFSLTISPDRKRVVFTTQFQYKHALWVANIDGSAAK